MADNSLRFYLANAILDIFKKEVVWFDNFFDLYPLGDGTRNFIAERISNYIITNKSTSTISGLLNAKSLDIYNISQTLSDNTKLHNANIEDLYFSLEFLLNSRLIKIQNSHIESYDLTYLGSSTLNINGYILLDDTYITRKEFGIDEDKYVKLLVEMSQLRQSTQSYKNQLDSSLEQIKILEKNISDKNSILAGQASLSWS